MPSDVVLDRPVGQRLSQVALGHHQVEQVGAIGAFGLLVLFLLLSHLLFQLFDLLDGRSLLFPLGGLHIGALLGRRGLEQGFGMRLGDGVAGDHQLHRLHLAGGLHVAQDAGDFGGELLVLQQGDGLVTDAFEQVDAPVDGAQVDVERPGQALLAHAPVDGAADHLVSARRSSTAYCCDGCMKKSRRPWRTGRDRRSCPVPSGSAPAGGRPVSGTRASCCRAG